MKDYRNYARLRKIKQILSLILEFNFFFFLNAMEIERELFRKSKGSTEVAGQEKVVTNEHG